jgi:hypothetical protein
MGARPDENPIHLVLNAVGVPWQSSRATLAGRYGIRPHPAYQWDVIEIDTRQPVVKGLIWPLSAQAFPQFSPHLPATEFSGAAYFGDDARENLRLTAKQLAPKLGEPQIADRHNTLHCAWAFGAAAISLTSWPPDLQRGPMGTNPAHRRDPRLVASCHVAINTGFRKAATAEELVWLNSFVPVDRIRVDDPMAADSIRGLPAEQSELEFVREPVADLKRICGFVGCSADRAALIFCHAQLYLVPMDAVIGFRVERVLPARGGGGSRLEVECRTNYEGLRTKRLKISSAHGVEDLNDLASAISAATDKPFELGKYVYDD